MVSYIGSRPGVHPGSKRSSLGRKQALIAPKKLVSAAPSFVPRSLRVASERSSATRSAKVEDICALGNQ
jgi:hypothetical protein